MDVKFAVVEPGLGNILEGITTKDTDGLVDTYMGPYNLLVNRLKNNKKLRGLMSQAVVPGLIRKMAKIPKEVRKNMSFDRLSTLLTHPTQEEEPEADYPYSQTRILEMLVGIRGDVAFESEDPLLMAAIRIANNMVDPATAKQLGDSKWVQKFSKGVNQIQDVIVRHMIFSEAYVIPLMGDESVPTPERAKELLPDAKVTRALGLGENPNPEMAAILNPALVMTKERRGQYLRELGLLSDLISPDAEDGDDEHWNKKLRGVFSNAGFEFSEVELGEDEDVDDDDELGDDDVFDEPGEGDPKLLAILLQEQEIKNKELLEQIQNLEERLETAERSAEAEVANRMSAEAKALILENENKKLKKEIDDLKKQKKTGIPAKPAPEQKVEVDYKLKALNHLISYLGVGSQIPLVVARMLELNALDNLSPEDSKNKINRELSELIRGSERLLVLREDEKKPGIYTVPMIGRREYVATLSHADIIKVWKAANLTTTGVPLETDLFFVKMQLKKGKKLKKELDKQLIIKRGPPLGSNISTPITIDYTKKLKAYSDSSSNNGLRRNKNQRGGEVQVLVW